MKLNEGIQEYLRKSRLDGRPHEAAELTLTAFCKQTGNVVLEDVTTQHIKLFLDHPNRSSNTWRTKHSIVRRFFEFWSLRAAIAELVMPQLLPPSSHSFIPYIYTRTEIRTLLRAVRGNQGSLGCQIEARTLHIILILLYATGAWRAEIVNLSPQDINLDNGTISFRGSRMADGRMIPISPELCGILRTYFRQRPASDMTRSHVFADKNGRAIKTRRVLESFQRLRRRVGIVRTDGTRLQPRLHDLRPTFAVHHITSWIKGGKDLNQMLPALSAYMGYKKLISCEKYLSLTPERFRKELDKLSPGRGKKKWRNDSDLMAFLASL
jgi:integrase/recombinase XerD